MRNSAALLTQRVGLALLFLVSVVLLLGLDKILMERLMDNRQTVQVYKPPMPMVTRKGPNDTKTSQPTGKRPEKPPAVDIKSSKTPTWAPTKGRPRPNVQTKSPTPQTKSLITDLETERPKFGPLDSEILLNDSIETPDVNVSKRIHITHVFNSFSSKGADRYEMLVVQASWRKAADLAKQEQGLEVEFIDATTPDDTRMSPPWARRYDLKYWINDFEKGKVPIVGEPFEIAITHGKGEVIVWTNSDIATTPDFYMRVYDSATRDPISDEVQLDAIKKAAKYLSICFLNYKEIRYDGILPVHLRMCREDAKMFYMHYGGFPELWNYVVEDIGILAAKQYQDAYRQTVHWARFKELMNRLLYEYKDRQAAFFSTRITNPAALQEAIKDFTPRIPPPEALERFKNVPFAATITRVDVDYTITPITRKQSTEDTLSEVLKEIPKSGRRHPGNDCFVFRPKGVLPKGVSTLVHPPGVRPFGQWIAQAFFHDGFYFRRITGSKSDAWTFHIGHGIWGSDLAGWRDRASMDEAYLLFLAGLFDRNSNGAFSAMYESQRTPRLCRDYPTAWRSGFYCSSVPEAFCSGHTRFSCYYYANKDLRDSMYYLKSCGSLYNKRQGKISKPVCDICNKFFEWSNTRYRFECTKSKFEWCEGLAEGACDFEDSASGDLPTNKDDEIRLHDDEESGSLDEEGSGSIDNERTRPLDDDDDDADDDDESGKPHV